MRKGCVLSVVVIILFLAACGGGGGSNGGEDIPITLKNIDVKADDIIVNVAPDEQSLASLILRTMVDLVGGNDALAASGITYSGNEISKKMVHGQILDLNITLEPVYPEDQEDFDELEDQCVFGNPEISINSVFSLDSKRNRSFVSIDYPASVSWDCTVLYKTGTFVVVENGDAFLVFDEFYDYIPSYIPANNQMFNLSDTPIVFMPGESPASLLIYDEVSRTITFEEITPPTVSIDRDVSFDGTYLTAKDGKSGYLFKRGEQGFTELDDGWINSHTFFNADHELMTLYDGRYNIFDPEDVSLTIYPNQPPQAFGTPVLRYGNRIISLGQVVWNTETNQIDCLFGDANPDYQYLINSYCESASYSWPIDNYYVAYEEKKGKFYRRNLDTWTIVTDLDVSDAGYSNVEGVELFKDRAYFKYVNPKTANKEYVEVDFETGQFINHGVIQDGARKITVFHAFN